MNAQRKKIEVAYYIAKEELPIIKYASLVDLEERHGVDISKAYRNRNSGGVFIDCISDTLADELKQKLLKVNFYSILTDGSTDSAISENEAVFIIYSDPGVETIKIVVSFLKLVFLKSAAAYDIVDSISDAFKFVNIDNFYEKLVGFGADGASVNRGNKQNVKAILREEIPWLTFGWWVAHHLELALKYCLKGTAFDDIDEIILRLHYLYKNSPKKLRQLKELVTIYEQA